MKHTLFKLFLAVLLLVGYGIGTSAQIITVNGIKYSASPNDGTAQVLGSDDSYSGSVVIPSSFIYNNITYSVTSIGYRAFEGCTELTSITIPISVTAIGSRAFKDCTGLYSVTIPNNVTRIEAESFSGCTGLTSINIPNSITSISNKLFYGCSSLTSVNIPNSVTSIGDHAFYGCSGLTSTVIGNSVTSIGNYAFAYCTGLTSVTIGNSVTSIDYDAFLGCTGLTSITIPNSVTSIGAGAFNNCTSITEVHISDLAAWCMIDVDRNNHANPMFYAKKLYLNGELVRYANIPSSVTSICCGAFYGCTDLIGINIPNSVTSIGEQAFSGCSGLTSVTIPSSVTSIGSSAFCNCTGLTSVNIPNSVTSIESYTFYGCSGLTSITIPNSVRYIDIYAFDGCSSLTSVNIPNSVTSIGSNAFWACTGLTSVTIGNSVTTIRSGAFYGCSGLTSVSIPNSVTSIERHAFCRCSSLTSVIIPSSVTSIGEGAFSGCSELTSVTIPSSVTSIGSEAFSGCNNLTKICSWVAEPLSITSNTFSKYYSATLYVPEASVQKYKRASYWLNFNILAVESLITLSDTDLETTTLNHTFPLSATITSPFISNKSVVWSSSDTNIATVSDNGLVTTVGFGTATITVQSVEEPRLKKNCTVFVRALVTDLSLDKTSLTFTALGSTQTLTARIAPDYAVNKTVTWKSGNNAIAMVDNNGIVTPKANGTTTITATTTDGTDLQASCIVSVNVATGISLNKTSIYFNSLNNTQQLTVTIVPENVVNQNVVWSSSNENVATVDNNGVVTPKANGSATITATTTDGTNFSATCAVTVTIAATSISLDNASLSFNNLDNTRILNATVLPDNAANRSVEWTCSNTTVASVSSSGKVTPLSSGTATITATTTDGTNLSASCEVYVNVVGSITLDKTSLYFNPNGEPQQLTAIILPDNAANKFVVWTSSNVNVAIVDGNGVVTPKGSGNATITAATIDGTNLKAACAVAVGNAAESVSLDKTSLSFNDLFGVEVLSATVLPNNAVSKSVTWASDNTAVAEVSGTGIVTPKGYGTAIITATTTDGTNLTATCEVTVKVATGISLDKTSLSFTNFDETQMLTVTILPENATNRNVVWASSDTKVATVSNGVVTPTGYGNATITAITLDGTNLQATCDVTVSNPIEIQVNSIGLSNTSLSLTYAGQTSQLTATVLPADATNKGIVWTSSNTEVATVDANGLVTAKGNGNTIITVTSTDGSNKSATCNVTVSFSSGQATEPDTDLSQYSNVVYGVNLTASIGGQAELSINMKNSIEATGYQFDLVLPDGITLAEEDGFPLMDLSLERTTKRKTNTFDCDYQPDGSLRVICNSTGGYAFSGNDGEVAVATLNIASTLEDGDYPIILKNIVVTDATGNQRFTVDRVKSTITLESYTLGDANADNSVDIADYSAIVQKILGHPAANFVEKAADINGDNTIDVSDLSGLAYMILHPNTGSSPSKSFRDVVVGTDPDYSTLTDSDPADYTNTLYASKATGKAGQQVTLSVNMKNSIEATGYQFDLVLPAGVTVAEEGGFPMADLSLARTTARKTNTFDCDYQADGSLRVICNSTGGYAFEDHDGEVATVVLNLASTLSDGDYPIVLKNIVVTDATGNERFAVEMMKSTLTVGDVAPVYDENYNLQVIPFQIAAGTDNTIDLLMKNKDAGEINMVDFDLVLPAGITLYKEDGDYIVDPGSRFASSTIRNRFACDVDENTDGSLHLSAYFTRSTASYVFSGTSGDIAALTLVAGATLADGIYEIELKNIKFNDDNTIKIAPYKASVFVGHPDVTNAVLYGNYTVDAVDALNDCLSTDGKLISIDMSQATAVENGVEILPANTNCLIYVPDGTVLANADNVVDGSGCDNLVLTDGKPFGAAKDFVASTASYTRNVTSKYGTICLPYPVSSDASVKYYTLDRVEGSTLYLTEETEIAAGVPAVYENLTDGGTVSATAANVNIKSTTVLPTGGDLKLIGTFEKLVITDPTELAKSYYISKDQFHQATNSLTVNPFRAYFTYTGSSSSKTFSIAADDSITALGGLNGNAEDIESIYDVSGAKLSNLQKGVNIVKYSNGKTQKIVIK